MESTGRTPTPEPFPQWDTETPLESLNRFRDWAVSHAERQIDWYQSKRKPLRTLSQLSRILCIVFFAVGGLFPLIDAALPPRFSGFGEWGYVCFVLAGSFLGLERFFGVSGSWMRFTLAWMELNTSLNRFRYQWAAESAKLNAETLDADRAAVMLNHIRLFTETVDRIVREETDIWIGEFRNRLVELEKRIQSRTEKSTSL